MENTQNLTEVQQITDAMNQHLADNAPLTLQQQTWVDYCAVGGLISEVDGSFRMSPRNPKRKFTVEDLANELRVSRETLYSWSRLISGFEQRVAARRKELNSTTRVTQVWNGVYLKARSGNARAAAIFLANHDPKFKMPTNTVKHEAGNTWAKLLAKKRDRKMIQAQDIREGEIVDAAISTTRPTN